MTPPTPPRTVLITGSTDGLGRALAHRLAGSTGRHYDRLREARANRQAYDLRARAQLWEHSLKLVGHAGVWAPEAT
ncbi:hypothetical protein ACFWIQ_02215 [Kitasatospora sp. NPDC127059]|uniref:hypothetical protein n=1 Tax=unclassified Kitasatospora TaxID=2633591 RepID=UPI00364601F4